MQSGFLSCILCSLLILLQTLYDKLLVDKGSKAIVTTSKEREREREQQQQQQQQQQKKQQN
jgi:hypothetical protein